MPVRQLYVDLVQLGYAEEAIRGVVGLFQHSSFTDSFENAPTYRQEIKFSCDASVYSFPLMPSDTDNLYEIVLYSKRGELCRLFFSMPNNDAYLHQIDTYTTPHKGVVLIRKRFTDLEDTPNQQIEGAYLVSRNGRLTFAQSIAADDIDLVGSLLEQVLNQKANETQVNQRFANQNQTIQEIQDGLSSKASTMAVQNLQQQIDQKVTKDYVDYKYPAVNEMINDINAEFDARDVLIQQTIENTLAHSYIKKIFDTEALLQAFTPTETNYFAKAMDTERIFKYGKLDPSDPVNAWHVTSLGAAVANANVLFDSFNEYVAADRMFGGWDWHRGSVPANTSATTNIPLLTPKLSSNGSLIDKQWDFSKLGLKAGDVVTVNVLCYFGAANGRVAAYFRQTDDTILATQAVAATLTGLQVLTVKITVPVGAIAKFLIRADYKATTSAIIEVGAYSAAVGIYVAAFAPAPMPKEYLSKLIPSAANLIFDPFNETIDKDTRDDSLQSVRNAVFSSVLTASPNSPFRKPTLQATGTTFARRYIDVAKLGVKVGDKVRVRVAAYFSASTAESAGVFLRKSDDTNLDSQLFTATSTGLLDVTTKEITITSDSHHILIAINGTANKELVACAIGSGSPGFNYGATPASKTNYIDKSAYNYATDPFYRLYDAGITSIDGYPLLDSSWSVVNYATSPFERKRAIFVPNPALSRNKNIKAGRLGLKLNDKVTCKVGIVIPQGGEFQISAYFRRADDSVITGLSSRTYTLEANTYTEIEYSLDASATVISEAACLQIRLNTANTTFTGGYYVCGWGVYKNTNVRILDQNYVEDELRAALANPSTTTVQKFKSGEWYTRETRQRTRKLKL